MGDRIVYTIKQGENEYLSLYSHWGGYSRYRDLAIALENARPRWEDTSYGTRIIISQLIGPDWASETGFGLWVGEDNGVGEYQPLIIDFPNKTVIDETGTHSFDEFVKYHLPVDKKQEAVV